MVFGVVNFYFRILNYVLYIFFFDCGFVESIVIDCEY